MSCRRTWLWVLGSLCMDIVAEFIICCSIGIAEDKDRIQEIWRKKVPDETKRFFDSLKSRETKSYTYSAVNTLPVDGKLRSFNARKVMKRNGPFWLICQDGDADNPMTSTVKRCYGSNSKYAFVLKGSKSGKDWVVHNITEITPDLDEQTRFNIGLKSDKGEGRRATVNSSFDSFDKDSVFILLFSGTTVGRTSNNSTVEFASRSSTVEPWKIAEIPGFRLRSISTDGPRQNILHVDFDYEAANEKNEWVRSVVPDESQARVVASYRDVNKQKNNVNVNCQMDFDIEAKCYPVKSHQVLKNGSVETILDWTRDLTETKENEYELRSLIQLKKKSGSVVTLLEETKEETVFSLNDSPESEFTLSAFGLPEPPGIEWKKPFPWYLVFAGIGIVCLGIFFFLRSRAQRLKT